MINIIFWLFAAICITFGCVLGYKRYLTINGRVLMSFRESMDLTDLPIVTFYNNKEKLNFLLDTGSNVSYINSSVIPKLKYFKKDSNVSTIGIEGNEVKSDSIYLINLTYKNKDFEYTFNSMNLNKSFNIIKKETGVQLHGILGSTFFKEYGYILDFSTLTARIK